MDLLPKHLQKYIVDQNYQKYTPVDQALWRYILRQLKNHLQKHAHSFYLEGLEKSGITTESIPKISEISEKLSQFGWRALPVSGFIPPAAFMELQSLNVLPIASDMRTLEHVEYTPAPDIVHEAAGHAPMLAHPEFANYLKQYAQVAKKAIISKEDIDLYEAIRYLSDLKENSNSTKEEIAQAENNLKLISNSMSHVSEASELSRMNWWTAEYGLIGDIENPKILGAGLLSSVGEAQWCLRPEVKKVPLTVDCIKQTYDITEPQPQLYVTPDFQTLNTVLEEMASKMAFRIGGEEAVKKAIQAQSVSTLELNSGVQISGVVEKYQSYKNNVSFIKFHGPTQISFKEQEFLDHSKSYHSHGYSSPIGLITEVNGNKLNLEAQDWSHQTLSSLINFGLKINCLNTLTYESGINVSGVLSKIQTTVNDQAIVLRFIDATVKNSNEIFFQPEWGVFDLILGVNVSSVFGGPADRISYGELQDFVAARVPQIKYSEQELSRHRLYDEVRKARESTESCTQNQLETFFVSAKKLDTSKNWLLWLELYELALGHNYLVLQKSIYEELNLINDTHPNLKSVIINGIKILMPSTKVL